ncbi:hypothetical protein HYS99_01155 [Candidatus Giovannonibacteria bacterium]|nr:hypothetical protein [Candidatus Giovannonibacteria bacterium]
MNKKFTLYLVGFICVIIAAIAFRWPEILLGGVGMIDLRPLFIFAIFGTTGLVLIGLAMVQKTNSHVAQKKISPAIMILTGLVILVVTFFDKSIGLDLFGTKSILIIASIIFFVSWINSFFQNFAIKILCLTSLAYTRALRYGEK